MKYKVGDRVKIKNLDWYNENKDEYGYVRCIDFLFTPEHSKYCGCEFTISHITEFRIPSYVMESNGHEWTDEMIEGLAEEETKFGTASNPLEPKSNANYLTQERVDALATKIDKELPSGNQNVWELPDGYQFTDEDGNVINATKIVLEKKKKEYPKTYDECYQVTGLLKTSDIYGYKNGLLFEFQKLLIARDAYWKIAGEEMGLGKPWKPDWTNQELPKYCSANVGGQIKTSERYIVNTILAFPTEEMRDAFKNNFDPDIEFCKELL